MGEILGKNKTRQGRKLFSFFTYEFFRMTSSYRIEILEWYLLQKKINGSISVESIHERDLDILIKLLLFNNEFKLLFTIN